VTPLILMRIDVKYPYKFIFTIGWGRPKRGLSPVIASVLMILMVVVLASMVFLWAQAFFENQTENSELSAREVCSYVSFNVILDDGNILEIVNRGNINISAFEVKMYSDGNSEIVEIDVGVPAGKSIRQEVDLGDINFFDEIEIFPVLNGESSEKQFTCHEEAVPLLNS